MNTQQMEQRIGNWASDTFCNRGFHWQHKAITVNFSSFMNYRKWFYFCFDPDSNMLYCNILKNEIQLFYSKQDYNVIEEFLNDWQDFSDKHFGDLQIALSHLFSFITAVLISLTRFSCKHLGRAFAYWQDAAKREQLLSLIMGYVTEVKRYGQRIYKRVTNDLDIAIGYILQVYDQM